MEDSIIVIASLNELLKEILINYAVNVEDGLISGYVESQETYDLFMSYITALGYSYSVRSSHARQRRQKTNLDERFLFQYEGGKGIAAIEFIGPLFSIKQVIHMDCAFGSKYYKQKLKNGVLSRKPRNLGLTKKLDCPAKLCVRIIKIYPDFCVLPNTKWNDRVKIRDQLSQAVKSSSPPASVLRFYITSTPEESHNHTRIHPHQKPVITPRPATTGEPLTTSDREVKVEDRGDQLASETPIMPTDHTHYSEETVCTDTVDNAGVAGDSLSECDPAVAATLGDDASDKSGEADYGMYIKDGDRLFEMEECEFTPSSEDDRACDSLLKELEGKPKIKESMKKVHFQDVEVDSGVQDGQRCTKDLQERLRSEIKKLSSLTYLCKNDSILEQVLASVSEDCASLEHSWVTEGSLGVSVAKVEKVVPRKRKCQGLYRFPELLAGWKSPKVEKNAPRTVKRKIPLRYPELLQDWDSSSPGVVQH